MKTPYTTPSELRNRRRHVDLATVPAVRHLARRWAMPLATALLVAEAAGLRTAGGIR